MTTKQQKNAGSKTVAAPAPTPIPSREDITAVVQEVVASLTGELTIGEFKLFQEVETLAMFIDAAKREILNVRPDDIPAEHIPAATVELDAVVEATAKATGTILDKAEMLDRLASTLPPEAAAQVNDAVTTIFEACNFQDITGQRITKVVKTLKYIESKIDGLVKAFGEELGTSGPAPGRAEPEGDEKLLNGPQLPQNANSQDEIDKLLASLF